MSRATLAAIGAFCMVLLGTSPLAAESQPSFLEGSCPSLATPSVSIATPKPDWLTSTGCYIMSDCSDTSYCWSLCPEAVTAACVNYVCQFTLTGGGSGPGGNACPQQRDCLDASQCLYPGGLQGSCINDLCVC